MIFEKNNILWIDRVKLLACALVVLGHLFQGLVSSGILPESGWYLWFNTTIYYFHVPLFFICSGYLHQMKAGFTSFQNWRSLIEKKTVILGIPYFAFSVATWVLKAAFSGTVNHQNKGLLTTLLLDPASPYWYLYALLLLFVISPLFSGRPAPAVAVAMKIAGIAAKDYIPVYAVSTVLENALWFVLGMSIYRYDLPGVCRSRKWKWLGLGLTVCFLALSIPISRCHPENGWISALMGLLGCAAVLLTIQNTSPRETTLFLKLRGGTMAVFLMHTIFAAGVRIVLTKLGIHHALVHILLGAVASFAGPLLAEIIMKRVKLDILIHPGKYIHFAYRRL